MSPATYSQQRERLAMSTSTQAWVAKSPKLPMVLETIDLGPLGAENVEVAVEYCGLCHFDVSVLNDEWGISQFPAVLGLEVIGRVTAVGPNTKGRTIDWAERWRRLEFGELHALPTMFVGEPTSLSRGAVTIVGHRGGFATRIRRPLGLGHSDPGRCKRRRCGAAFVRRHRCIRATGHVRQTDGLRGYHRHRRPRSHGR